MIKFLLMIKIYNCIKIF